MPRISQLLAALAMIVSGGLWAKPVHAVDAQPVAKAGGTVWPFGDTQGKCACAICTGKATIGKATSHTQL